jgi:transcriptional regulator with XRE-family HTH domain
MPEMTDAGSLGDRLRFCRKLAGLTQVELATASGISRGLIGKV